MSNNHDWPAVSASPDSAHRHPRRQSHLPTLLQHLRDHIRLDSTHTISAAQQARALEVLEQELAEMDADPMGRRQPRRARESDNEPARGSLSEARTTEDPGSAIRRSSRRMIRPSELLARQRMRTYDTGGTAQIFTQANSGTQSLLAEPHLPSFHAPLSTEESDGASRWRAKRRKLEADHRADGLTSISYGHFGQVVPGVLKMEVMSCDGGTYPHGDRSWPENVLLNDDSVYCTKSDKCNLVLRHQGGLPFDLSKIVIKAPKSGFDAPVQAGMLFVAMSAGDLLERTQGFEVQYWPMTSPCVRRRGRHSRFSRNESLRTDVRGAFRWSPIDRQRLPDDDLHHRDDRVGGEAFSNSPGPFEVTTTFGDDDEEEEDDIDEEDYRASSRRSQRSSRLLPGSRLAPWQEPPDEQSDLEEDDLDHDDDEDDDNDNESEEASSADADDDNEDLASFVNPLHPTILPALTMEPTAIQTNSTRPRITEDDVIRPHAKFFIERDKSMVSIKFDPPVAGKFILLKLWSSQPGGNIDIKNVTVSGFAGPRFFPEFQLR